jgi:hypothetical protein
MRPLILTLTVLAALAVLAAPVSGQSKSTTLRATLSGANEAPTAGDPDGSGSATVRINRSKRTACFTIRMSGIAGSAAAHIHRGATGTAGPVVVLFFGTQSTKTTRKGCARKVKSTLLRSIVRNPGRYYVNVHNADFPNGAIRGQLRK